MKAERGQKTMATIVKRRNRYSVVYKYTDEKGKKRQRWETFDTSSEAKQRKTEVEFQQNNNTFLVPTAKSAYARVGKR